MEQVLYLSSKDVRGLAKPAAFVDAVRDAYRQRGEGASAKPRYALVNDEPGGLLTGYAAILPETDVMGGYMYAAGFGDQTAWFATPLFEVTSGKPLAIVDGAWMNPFKTGAAGAVAVDALARDDASTVGLIGSGAQAAGQLHATATVRALEEVRVYSPTPTHRQAFAEEFNGTLDADVQAVDSSDQAIRDADIVITATTSDEPVFDGSLLAPGTHVTAMGQYHPYKREIDDETVRRATYVIDLADRIDHDAGAYLHARRQEKIDDDHLHAELGDVVAGTAPGRTSSTEITVFDSGGTGLETVAGAYLLVERAREATRGTSVPWFSAAEMLTGRP